MLYLYKHDSDYRNLNCSPSVGNFYELIETDDIEAHDHECCVEEASRYEHDNDWGNHIDTHGGCGQWFEYDKTDPVHVAHTGYEADRPEAVEYQKQAAIAREAKLLASVKKELAENYETISKLAAANVKLMEYIEQNEA